MFYGSSVYSSGNELYGNVYIASNQAFGYYDLEVFDNQSFSWIKKENAFYIANGVNIVYGCTDPIACNYDSSATTNDSTCIYLSNPILDITQGYWILDFDSLNSQFECLECHLSFPDGSGGELMYDITNAAGGEEFCGDELADAESNTFYFEIAAGDSLLCDDGGHPIYAGQYGPGADNAAGQAYEVHCDDHSDHGDHRSFSLVNLNDSVVFSNDSVVNTLSVYTYLGFDTSNVITSNWSFCVDYDTILNYLGTSWELHDSGYFYSHLGTLYQPINCDISNTFYSTSPSSNSSCDGFALAGGTSSYPIQSYSWTNFSGNNISSSNIAFGLCNDIYFLTITDSAGCVLQDTLLLGSILGCTDSTALNYNSFANTDDGSCIAAIYGCTDSTAFNYNSSANTDDGSCVPHIYGCIDSLAYNFDINANSDDNSCLYCDLVVTTYSYTNSGVNYCDGWSFVSVSSSNLPVTYLWSNGETVNNVIGLCSGYYTVTVTDSVGCSASESILIGGGCTDSAAVNYDPNASIDDGSCISCIYGCTDATAVNYDPSEL